MSIYETVSVIGLGYIGLPTAAVLASRGARVIGVDVNAETVRLVNEGRAHFFEPDLDEMVKNVVHAGRLRAVVTPEPADAFIIAVPTPVSKDNAPDLSYVRAAAASLASVLKKGDLVVLESTSPIGTIEMLSELLAARRPDLSFPHQAGEHADIRLAYCPERIIPGKMLAELVENDRIIGGLTEASTEAARALYAIFAEGALVPTTGRAAEMVKLTENAFRDVNIAFANELHKICDRFGIDAWEVIALANHHPRVNILNPGPGVGGHCIAVDPWFIVHAAPDLSPLMRAARGVNDGKPDFVIEAVGALARRGEAIACLGLAYKADTDDLRESPAVEIVGKLADAGYGPILAVEPNIEAAPKALEERGVTLSTLKEAVNLADVVVLLVDHTAFKEIDLSILNGKRVYDSRGIWPAHRAPRGRDRIAAGSQAG